MSHVKCPDCGTEVPRPSNVLRDPFNMVGQPPQPGCYF
jgi:hypothetical protein